MPVTGRSDVDYTHAPAAEKAKLEYRVLERMIRGAAEAREGGPELHQGIWLMTPSGRYLGKANIGWPSYDPAAAVRAMREALERYEALPRSERLLPDPLDPARDRMRWADEGWKRPDGVLDLRVVKRGLPFADMEEFDIRHPDYYGLDHLWLAPAEFRSLVPAPLAVGSRRIVTGAFVDRLVYDSHLVIGSWVWRENEIRRAEVAAEVVAVRGRQATIRFEGDFELAADNDWNHSRYRGNLLGEATWDAEAGRFTAFELLARGEHTLRDLRENLHRGSTLTTTTGMLVTMNGDEADDRIFPGNYLYGYPADWKR